MIRPSVKIGATKVALFLHLFTSLVDADDIFELPKGLTEQEIENISKISQESYKKGYIDGKKDELLKKC